MWDTRQRCPGQGASPGAERALGGHGGGADRRVSTLSHSGTLQKLSKGPLSSLSRVCASFCGCCSHVLVCQPGSEWHVAVTCPFPGLLGWAPTVSPGSELWVLEPQLASLPSRIPTQWISVSPSAAWKFTFPVGVWRIRGCHGEKTRERSSSELFGRVGHRTAFSVAPTNVLRKQLGRASAVQGHF